MTDAEHTTTPEPPTQGSPTPGTPGAPKATPTPSPGTTAPPTPGTLNKDVPAEAWRANLSATADAPAADRHARISDLLDSLEGQVGSL